MSKVKMLDPVGYQWLDTGHFRKKIPKGCDVSAFRELVTVEQAKAYSEARAREVLEYAAKVCEARVGTGDPGIDTEDAETEAKECAMAIRALIKNQ